MQKINAQVCNFSVYYLFIAQMICTMFVYDNFLGLCIFCSCLCSSPAYKIISSDYRGDQDHLIPAKCCVCHGLSFYQLLASPSIIYFSIYMHFMQ